MLSLIKKPPAIQPIDFKPGASLDVSTSIPNKGFEYILKTNEKGKQVSDFIKHITLQLLDGDFKIYKPIAFSIVGKDLVKFIDRTKSGQMPIYLSNMLSDFVFLDIPEQAFKNTGLGESFMLRIVRTGNSCSLFGADEKDLSNKLFSMSKDKKISNSLTEEMNIYFASKPLFGKSNNLGRLDVYPILGQTFLINKLVTVGGDENQVTVRFNGANDKINKAVFYEKLVELSEEYGSVSRL